MTTQPNAGLVNSLWDLPRYQTLFSKLVSDGLYTERMLPGSGTHAMASSRTVLCGRPRRRDEMLFVKGLCVS